MEQYFHELLNYLSKIGSGWAYAFLFVSSVVENLFPPIPGDTITALGAFLVATGRLNYFLVFIFTTIGSTTGFILLFFISRKVGRVFFENRGAKYFSRKSFLKAEMNFQKFGYYVVLANRFIPGVRSVVSITAGILELCWWKVMILAFISASAWNFIWIQAGYSIGGNWEVIKITISTMAARYNIFMAVIISVVILLVLLKKFYLKRKQ